MSKASKNLDAATMTTLKAQRAALATALLNAKHPAAEEKADKALAAFDASHPTVRNAR